MHQLLTMTPLMALCCDAFGTFITQAGYIWMKFGQISKEDQGSQSEKFSQSGFFTCKWLFGVTIVALGSVIHFFVLPFADLVLLACNSATAIVTSTIFAICLLGEKFMWKYDLPAMFLIILGNTLNIAQSNKVEDERETKTIVRHLVSNQALCFLFSIILYSTTVYMLTWLTKMTREFEQDCELWLSAGKGKMLDDDCAGSSHEETASEESNLLINENKHVQYDSIEPALAKKKPNIPTRVLIQLINSLDYDLIDEISPRSTKLKWSIKIPLVLMTWAAGLLVSTNLVMGKCFGEIVLADDVQNMFFVALGCAVCAGCGSFGVVYLLSLAMRYYDNIDVIPMFQSFILLMMLLAGWILLDEVRHYTRQQIIGILCSSLIVVAGIKVLTAKTSIVTQLKKNKERDETVNDKEVREDQDEPAVGLSALSYDVDSNGPKSTYSGDDSEEKYQKKKDAQVKSITKVFYS